MNDITTNDNEDSWMIRPCEMYKEEYGDCCSIKARFHQYFIHGESIDCSQWKKDFDNCLKWTKHKDPQSMKSVLESERKRRLERLQNHYNNNIWVKRSQPPTDWNQPLPDWMEKEYKDSYLDHKSQEMKGERKGSPTSERTLCSIS